MERREEERARSTYRCTVPECGTTANVEENTSIQHPPSVLPPTYTDAHIARGACSGETYSRTTQTLGFSAYIFSLSVSMPAYMCLQSFLSIQDILHMILIMKKIMCGNIMLFFTLNWSDTGYIQVLLWYISLSRFFFFYIES